MVVNTTEITNNFGRYLDIARLEDIVIIENGSPVARLIGMESTVSFLSDRLVGIVPGDIDEAKLKSERMARQ